jgi:outer membrane protein
MKAFSVVQALGIALIASTSFAQAPPGQAPKPAAPPVQPAPRPPAPAAPAAVAPAPTAPRFQDGLKYAYINVQVVAANSVEGKAATEKVKAFQEQKVKELNEKNKVLQSAQQKLEQGGSVMNDQARAQLQTEIERQQRDVQRLTEDAQQEVQNFTQQLQADFERKLNPIIDKVAREKQVHFVFSAAESGLVWADPGMDLTAEVIKAFDATGPAAAARPAAASPK